MKRNDWIVTEWAVRPAGPSDECFYCNAKLGEQHEPDCSIRVRTVVLRCTVQFVYDVPGGWDEEMVNFHLNESTWCASNIVALLNNGPECLCPFTHVEYVREATEEDEMAWGLTVRAAKG